MSLDAAARRAVEAALAAGATDAEAWAEQGESRQIRVYDGEVESMSDAGGRGIGVRVFRENRSGYAYGTDLDDVAATATAAVAAAAVADVDAEDGLPDEPGATAVEGLAAPGLSSFSTAQAVELALAIERAPARDRW
jgi:PmbA protein